ncbi:NADH dehydrogenase [ubiquinone] 1 alpha subcomplex subunit 1-like [Ptiloglossa arizonensis]|uniref:NADH dehydrogenase [ubiquinone] 1 alpha subcomplex subunit 1-like n=1 Tax=Ptiloglossa arizonensis TaxID=3350558 RepID=UPI003FA017D3
MWFELIPTIGLLGLFSTIPISLPYYINKFTLGNPYMRSIRKEQEYLMWCRDDALTGASWKLAGLEKIPDE